MKLENYLPISECKHGFVYKINSRNLSYGIYNEENKGFIGIRTKFGHRFLFTEYHWDTGAPFGTVCPIEEIENSSFTKLEESDNIIFIYLEKFDERP